jgi:hypothetical protein
VNTPLVPSGFYEVMRREEDNRTLVEALSSLPVREDAE